MIGRHLLVDFYGVAADRLSDGNVLERCLIEAARLAGLTPLGPPMIHSFQGGGQTAFLLLSESHIAVHTYPERGFVAIDIFSCGKNDPSAALEVFRSALAPETQRVTLLDRGPEAT